MKPAVEHMAFFRDLSPERAAELRKRLDEDPAAASLFRTWSAVRESIGADVREGITDPEVFALFVLREGGRGEALTSSERARVAEAAPNIEAALRRHRGLAAVADDVASDADAFDDVWERWFGDVSADPAHPGDRPVQRPARRRNGRVSAGRWIVRAGLGAAVIVFAAILILVGRRDFSSVTVTTSSGETRIVELANGSFVRMLGNSRLTYVPPEQATAIDLQAEFEGQAFFDVTPDGRGFMLKTPNAQAVVLGTSFGVQADARSTEVVLADGRLTLSPRRAPERVVVLAPGQMSRVEAGSGPSAPVDVRLHDRLSWTGLFVFQATPLVDILQELSRAYDAELSAEDSLLAERVTGRFEREQELFDVLQVVAASLGARIDESGSGFRLAAP